VALRLQRDVVAQLGLSISIDDVADAQTELGALAAREAFEGWRKPWIEALSRSRGKIVVEADESWTVLQGRRIDALILRQLLQADESLEDGVDPTSGEDDSPHIGRPVPLSSHCADVERVAREYGAALGVPSGLVEDLALAAWLHDIGKADRRFQVLLRGGSEIDFYKDDTPWAKSGMAVGAKAAHRLAAMRSGYPKGARHEMQSLAMIEAHADSIKPLASDIDLVLHLVASHHGHGRPFAPVAEDRSPVNVSLAGHVRHGSARLDFRPTMSNHELYKLDSSLADRFWTLVERYGWQGLCWLEAILRLADHRASETEQSPKGVS
jgi:CRISPR-associated endonuclease/helicase Cas3